ncbi:MAG: aminotransferase class I/II-fold pyridoxal phosphate-dependent enzyme [Acidobacteria bacterium]|nr:aminotransferase class I/II-fold pyridoxal phosphate-dependent enzyme [Acidobacteriota bacterium]
MPRLRLALASGDDREAIYRLRHAVYAAELGQHSTNPEGRLRDGLDDCNEYVVATEGGELAGFVSLTPPGGASYSIDKYFAREDVPVAFDDGLWEVRLLTVPPGRRGRALAFLLMYAAFRRVESRGGARIVAIGRRELLGFYRKAGLRPLGPRAQAGRVTYELMTATLAGLRTAAVRFEPLLHRLRRTLDWELDVPFQEEACFHGGAFFTAIGETFETLERRDHVVNADVLDAWFPPAPGALRTLADHLPWLLRTSPPTDGRGLIQVIAEVRGVPAGSLALGAGSSSLIFLAFRQWLTPASRVLLPDPTYGEYAHVLERVVGCRTDRLRLARAGGYRLDPEELLSRLRRRRYDLVVLVNPNNPTGQLLPQAGVASLLAAVPAHTRVWIDEAYIDYAGSEESVERLAAASGNVVVCKSLSKVYSLSGARAAYLCGPPALARELRSLTPPWAVSLPAQVAAVAALRDPAYYAGRYRQTAELRQDLVASLREVLPGAEILAGVANYVLCLLPRRGPDAATVCERCRGRGVFLRDSGATSAVLGRHALRVAVKDEVTNRRVVETLAWAWA